MTDLHTGSSGSRPVAPHDGAGEVDVRAGLAPLVPPAPRAPGSQPARRVLLIGGGYVGLYTALTLQKKLRGELRRGQVQITVVDPRPYMTYQPFLPEVAAGSLEAREVVVSLRRELNRCTIIDGRLDGLRHTERTARIQPSVGAAYDLGYDVIVVAPGSISKTLPIPGLADAGIGFKQVEEAVGLRNHVLAQLDVASSTADPEVRARALTFVFVGGGYAGIEAFAELQDMARFATRYHPGIGIEDMHWMLVEASDRILAEVSQPMADYTVDRLREREMDVRLSTRLDSCVDGQVELSDGTSMATDTIVWTAGVKPNPVLERTDFDLDRLHRIPCTADLRVRGVADAWSAGDCAAVPDLTKGDGSPDSPTCAPNAQHAVRQAKLLGLNIVRTLRGHQPREYRHKYVGSVASLGLYQGVAEVYGVKLKGLPAWLMHRTYHLSRMPTLNRKARIGAEWFLSLLFRRDVTPIAQLATPNRDFRRAADPVEQAARGGNRADDASRNLDDLGRDPRADGPAAVARTTRDRQHTEDRPHTDDRPHTADHQATHHREGTSMTEHTGPGRPTPTEERNHREEGLPAKTTHDAEQDLTAADAPDTPGFGDRPGRVSGADEVVARA